MNVFVIFLFILLALSIVLILSFILVKLFVISDLLIEFIEDRKTDLYNISDIEL